MKEENNTIDAEAIANSIKSKEVDINDLSVQQVDAFIKYADAIGKLPELGSEYISLLKENLKTHDKYQDQLLVQFDKIQNVLLTSDLNEAQRKCIMNMFHDIQTELVNIRISKDENGKHTRNWLGTIALGALGVIIILGTGGRAGEYAKKFFKA